MKKSGYLMVAFAALMLVILACTCSNLSNLTPTTTSGTGSTGSTTGGQPTTFAGGDCDPRSTRIEPNQSYSEQMPDTQGSSYPDNCQYYCLWAPGGYSTFNADLTNMSEDLDMYVQYGSFAFGSDIPTQDANTWFSNQTGTGNEQVSINQPQEGVYYFEICSYEGKPTSYNLATTLR